MVRSGTIGAGLCGMRVGIAALFQNQCLSLHLTSLTCSFLSQLLRLLYLLCIFVAPGGALRIQRLPTLLSSRCVHIFAGMPMIEHLL